MKNLSPLCILCSLTLIVLMAVGDWAEARGPRGGRGGGVSRGGGFGGGRSLGRAATPGPRGFTGAPGVRVNGASGFGKPAKGSLGATPGQLQGFLNGAQPKASQLQNRNGQHAASAQSAVQNFQSGPQPFSPAWYAQHPTAWQHTHPHADAVAVASVAAVGAWINYGVYPYPATYPATGSSTTVVVESALEPTPAEPVTGTPAVAATAPVAQPEWLPLGVYELKPNVAATATHMVDLAVNRQGDIKGVYFDHLAGTTQDVAGAVNLGSQTATWSVVGNSSVSFSAPLGDLSQPQGGVTVSLPAGQQTWVIQRPEGS